MKAPQAHMAFAARCSSRLNVFSPCNIKVFHFMVNDLGVTFVRSESAGLTPGHRGTGQYV